MFGAILVAALGVALILWTQFQPGAPLPVHATNAPPAPVAETSPEAALPSDPVQLINDGTEQLSSGHPEKAVQLYTKALEINPDDEEGHFGLAVAYARLGRTNEAIRHYEEALRIFPDYSEAHNNLGNLLLAQGQQAKAIQHYLSALKVQPQYTSAMNNLGRALAEQGKLGEAIHYFQEAVNIDTNYLEARCNLATTLLQAGRPQEAALQLTEVFRQKPGFPPAVQILSRVRQTASTNQP